jgi:hypothetical protein
MLLSLGLAASTGCIIHSYDDDPDVVVVDEAPPPPPPVYNTAPVCDDGAAWVTYDAAYLDDIWQFEAVVDDFDGIYDVTQVWADVYDEYAGGVYIESFELLPTSDPYVFWSDWLGTSTLLDPFYQGYTVDFVVYDVAGDFGVQTVWASTY